MSWKERDLPKCAHEGCKQVPVVHRLVLISEARMEWRWYCSQHGGEANAPTA